jgi:competence protein ComEC
MHTGKVNFRILKRDIHISWLISVLAGGIVVGVILAQYSSFFASLPWVFFGITLCIFGFWRRKVYMIPLLIIAGSVIGLWRGGILQSELAPYKDIIGFVANIEGTVSEDPEIDKNGTTLLRLNVLRVDNHELKGKVWVSVHAKNDIKRGDIVTTNGKLSAGFGNFAASMYRADLVNVQRPVPGDVAGRARDLFAGKIREVVGEPEASLGIGYLLGQRRSLPPDLDEALQIAGLTHIVVASGYNLTILVRFARRIFIKISKYLSALTAGSMIVAFVLITGLSPSMSRAGLVAGLSLLAWYYGRKFHPLVLLSFTAAITLLINPTFGWNDLGWQLSFLAFAGVMILAPLLQAYFFGDKEPGAIRQILGETISAQIATFPILVASFGVFSNVAIVANLLVLPLVPLAMLLVFLCGIFAIIVPLAAIILAHPTQWLLGYMISVAKQLAELPWAQTALVMNGWAVAGVYIVLALTCFYLWRKTGYNLRSNIVE